MRFFAVALSLFALASAGKSKTSTKDLLKAAKASRNAALKDEMIARLDAKEDRGKTEVSHKRNRAALREFLRQEVLEFQFPSVFIDEEEDVQEE